MRVVIAPDSFKECMSASEAAGAIAEGVMRAVHGATTSIVPMADGGEGTAECLSEALGCERIPATVCGPLLSPVRSSYFYNPTKRYAVIESAAACGLALIKPEHRDPLMTSSRGVGELILLALRAGAEHILVTVGGTATIDFGSGMASALGYTFLDARGFPLPAGGGSLQRLEKIIRPESKIWEAIDIVGACDVFNPLLGEKGAARVFGPQKGAHGEASIVRLESGLARMRDVLATQLDLHVGTEAGAGAGGGLGAGLKAFLGAELVSGIDLVIDHVGLEAKIRHSDWVITGEGRTDSQSSGGKVCSGVCKLARKHGVPCVVLSGQAVEPLDDLRILGATEIIGISPPGEALAESLLRAKERLTNAAEEVARKYGRIRGARS